MTSVASCTDGELLDRARQGDHRAFQHLVERYEGKVAATVISMLGRTPEADDIGQETFIRFYKSMDTFRGDASLGTYLTRIAINQSLKALKRRKSWKQRFFSRDEEAIPTIETAIEGSEVMDERERAVLVQRALQMIGPEHRAVVVLRMLDGYSTKETADLLGIPPGTVMSRLSRAMQKLETILVPLLNPT